jgi:hypothetical protein
LYSEYKSKSLKLAYLLNQFSLKKVFLMCKVKINSIKFKKKWKLEKTNKNKENIEKYGNQNFLLSD